MRTLRARLIAWYVSVGAFIVLIIGLLAATATIEAASFEVRQAMAAAATQVPPAVAQYRATHKNMRGLDPYLHQRFKGLGVMVHAHVLMQAPPPFFLFGRGQRMLRPPGMGDGLFERLLAMQIKPIRATFKGGDAEIFVDPHTFNGLFGRLGLFILLLAIVVLTAAWRLAIVVAKNTLEPLVRTTEALNRFGSGVFTPVEVRDGDRSELADLARAYNRAVGQITRALDEREKAEAEMRQFVADAGHQLRTPLTVIMGYLSGMLQRVQSIGEGRRIDTMLAQSRRMKDLIDRLITLARLEHRSEAQDRRIDLNDIADRAQAGFAENAQMRIAVKRSAEPAYARAEETELLESVCALVDNALKYAPDGPVEITVERRGEECALGVADRGPGMTSGDLESAFDRFYRGSAADDVQGTGLGLAIVRKSIERMGGSVTLENRSGGGLEAWITLRAFQAADATLIA